MAEQTNAQAALQATATLYNGASGYARWDTLTSTANQFKEWLDAQDAKDKAATTT